MKDNQQQEIIEVMADAIAWLWDKNDTPTDAAKAALKALQSAGYQVIKLKDEVKNG